MITIEQPEILFSAVDPDYRIKGSRDPLGLQVLWAGAGRKAVAYLSTVSLSITDFRILSYARYLYQKILLPSGYNESFTGFFIKFEQACAYARYHINKDISFNGITKVKATENDNKFPVSLKNSDALMSNQRAYGILGKYIRPFTDMKIDTREEFDSVMEGAFNKNTGLRHNLMQLINRLKKEKDIFTIDDLQPLGELLNGLTAAEKDFYTKYILQIDDPVHPQNNLYQLLKNNAAPVLSDRFNLHSVINGLVQETNISEPLKKALINIQNTDRVLYPVNRWFLRLLNRSHWSNTQIEEDEILNKTFPPVSHTFDEEELNEMNNLLNMPATEKVKKIIERNKEIQEKRKNRAWIVPENNGFAVIYGETEFTVQEIDPANDFEFSYFLNTYLTLFRQIELSE